MIAEGATLAGKYRVLNKLGEGGMGAVFRATNTLTGKQVALKFLPSELTEQPDAVARLLREARVLSRFSHPNVVDVYDLLSDDGHMFLVMELLKGQTLAEYVERQPVAKISELIALLLAAMAGVAAAHRVGVLHRDLKPANIFLEQRLASAQPVAKVLDFGIAKLMAAAVHTSQPVLTQTGEAVGTPLYMSLEQLRGDRDLDVRVDVYAFGVMLYEIVTGRKPYFADNLTELACKVATSDAPRVSQLRPDVPAGLASVIDAAVARQRDERLPDIATLQEKLEAFAMTTSYRRGVDCRPLVAAQVAACSGEADTLLATQLLDRSGASTPKRLLWGGLCLGIVVLLAAVAQQITQEQVTDTDAAVRAPPHEVRPLATPDAGFPTRVEASATLEAIEGPSPIEVAAPRNDLELGVGTALQDRKAPKLRPRKARANALAEPTSAVADKPKSQQDVLGF